MLWQIETFTLCAFNIVKYLWEFLQCEVFLASLPLRHLFLFHLNYLLIYVKKFTLTGTQKPLDESESGESKLVFLSKDYIQIFGVFCVSPQLIFLLLFCGICSVMFNFVTPWIVAHQAPLSMEFSRQEHWCVLAFPSPGDLLDPGIEPGSPALQADSLPSELYGSPWYSL